MSFADRLIEHRLTRADILWIGEQLISPQSPAMRSLLLLLLALEAERKNAHTRPCDTENEVAPKLKNSPKPREP